MNDEEIKVSELDLADEIRDTDQIMIVQGGINKKVKGEKINDKTISNSYGNEEKIGYSQKYQNEHNVIVSLTAPTTSERVWFKKSANLFNFEDVEAGYLDGAGNVKSNNYYSSSNYIYIKVFSKITVSGNSGNNENICFYDSGKTFISYETTGSNTSMTLNVPNNAYYVRATVKNTNLNQYQLEEGSTATAYEPYKQSINVDNEEIYSTNSLYGISLYRNASGTHEAFTLSEDIKHFREIEITFGRSSWTNMKQKLRVVPQQSGTTPIGLIALYPTTDGNSLVLASAVFEIGSGGTNATFPRNTSGTIGSTGFVKDTATYVNVYEVVGYK